MDSKNKWKKIPTECVYKDKKYHILQIDIQGGFFTLYDSTAKKGEVQVLECIDMEECCPVAKCESSPTGEHEYVMPPDSFDQPFCKHCYKSN